jgi:hypothetical protein
MPVLGARAANGVKHASVLRILDRGLFEHRNGLRALAILAQCPRIVDSRVWIAWIGAVAFAPGVGRAPPIRAPAGCSGSAERACRLGWLRGRATQERERKPRRKRDGSKAAKRIAPLGTVRASHRSPIGPHPSFGNNLLTLTRS